MDFDFGAISSQVSNYLQGGDKAESTPASSEAPSGSPTTLTGTASPQEAQEPATPVTPADPLVEVDLGGGRVEKLTAKQIREGYLRQSDYTRKTQELAEHRRAIEAQKAELANWAEERKLVEQVMTNPQALLYLAQQQMGAVPQIDPNETLTVGQAQSLAQQQYQTVAKQLEQLQEQFDKKLQERVTLAQQEIEDRQATAKYGETINGTLKEIYTEHPILQSIPEMEDVIRFRVAQMQPQNIEEALDAFRKVGTELAKVVSDKVADLNKSRVAAKQSLATGGIEPPGGAGVQPTPQSFRNAKTGAFDWKGLSDAARNYVEANRK